jgi:hypothetical protein
MRFLDAEDRAVLGQLAEVALRWVVHWGSRLVVILLAMIIVAVVAGLAVRLFTLMGGL